MKLIFRLICKLCFHYFRIKRWEKYVYLSFILLATCGGVTEKVHLFFSGFFVAKRGRAGCNFFYLRCRQIFSILFLGVSLQIFPGRIMIVEFEANCFNFWLAALLCCQAELRTIKIWLRWRHSRAYYIFLRWGACS